MSQEFRQGTVCFSSAPWCLETQLSGGRPQMAGEINAKVVPSLVFGILAGRWQAVLTWDHWLEHRCTACLVWQSQVVRLLPWHMASPGHVSQENQAEAPWPFRPGLRSHSVSSAAYQQVISSPDSRGGKLDFPSWSGNGKVTLQKSTWDGRHRGECLWKTICSHIK